MRFFDLRTGTDATVLHAALALRTAPAPDGDAAEESVRTILSDVRSRGDAAVLDYTRRFDFPEAQTLRVPDAAIVAATNRVRETPLWDALHVAARRIRAFHEKTRRESWLTLDTPGDTLGQLVRPLSRVGVYAPGGTAAYPSTVLMAALPAQVAGVPQVVLATPPSRETGLPPDATLAAAFLAGVSEVYAMGGAQAIAALAFGTESIAPVVKVVGPGNRYVNIAKRLVVGVVGIDMLAGPSEVGVLADDTARVQTVATEIIAQTEHDPLNSALVATTSPELARALPAEIERQLADLSRAGVVRAALRDFGYVVLSGTLADAIAVINEYAPEHLHVYLHDPWQSVAHLQNAGAILIGESSTAALGDYVAGPCHTLPTAGSSRYASPLGVDDFVKRSNIIALGNGVAQSLSGAAQIIANFEGLEAHARSARPVLND